MKKFLLTLASLSLIVGCTDPHWLAKVYMLKAENAFSKAYMMRVDKKISYDVRLKYYQGACSDFKKAFHYDPDIFTLYRIETAADSCLRMEDFEGVEVFRKFEEEYSKKHPREVKYGDVGPWMNLES